MSIAAAYVNGRSVLPQQRSTANVEWAWADGQSGGIPVAALTAFSVAPSVGAVQFTGATATITLQIAPPVTAGTVVFSGAAPSLTVAQHARPTSDVSAGTWTPSTGTDLYAMLDENPADDDDYILSAADPVEDTAVLALSALSVPAAGTVTLSVRHRLAA